MKFKVDNKKTYYSKGLISINKLDTIFNPFFYCVEKQGGFLFNLPKGNYELKEGTFLDADENLNYNILLPMYETDVKDLPKKLTIGFKRVNFKAVIYKKMGKIFIDNSFLELPQYVTKFLVEHEKGHYFYNTEKYCDLYAAKKLLELGYNPSQIYDAIALTLSKDSTIDRVDFIKTKLMRNELDTSYN